jgi:hypothetical protein
MEVGPPPVGPVREVETDLERRQRARREEARHAAQDAADEAAQPARPAGGAPAAGSVRTGVAGTRRFHVAGCPELAQAAAAEQVTFVSAFDALDAGYAPCPSCRPGP